MGTGEGEAYGCSTEEAERREGGMRKRTSALRYWSGVATLATHHVQMERIIRRQRQNESEPILADIASGLSR
jgi:hypothetical protein